MRFTSFYPVLKSNFVIFGQNVVDLKNTLFKIAKIFAWILGILVALLLLIIIAIQIPSVQNKIKDKAIVFLETKLGTAVALDRIEIAFPKKIVVKGLYLESQEKDTLLYTGYLGVDISLFKLLNQTVDVSSIELDNFNATVKRDSTGRFNFDYIVEAFASEDDKEEESAPFKIELGIIDLKNIKAQFQDDYEGHHLHLKLDRFLTRIKSFDLEAMKFAIPKIAVSGLDVNYKHSLSLAPQITATDSVEETTPTTMPQLDLKAIEFSDIKIQFEDEASKLSASVVMGRFETILDLVDLQNQEIEIDRFSLSDTRVKAHFSKKPQENTVAVAVDSVPTESMAWKVGVQSFDLKQLAVAFDDDNAAKQKQGIDFKHLDFSTINVKLKDFRFAPNIISGNLKQLSVSEKSGLEVEKLQTYFLYGEQNAFLKDFYLKTPNTEIQTQVVANYKEQQYLTDKIEEVSLDLSLTKSYLGVQDVLILMPDLIKQDAVRNFKNSKIKVDVVAKGLVKDLEIERFALKGLGSTVVDMSGRIKGLPDAEKAYYNLDIKNFKTTASDLNRLLPANVVPESIQLPTRMSVQGNFKGTVQDFATQLRLNSTSGDVSLVAQLNQKIKNQEKYRIDGVVNNLDLGAILKNDSIGKVSLTLQATGKSFDPKQADAILSGHLLSATYNDYEYKDLILEGALKEGAYNAKAFMKDPNILFEVVADGKITDEQISLKMDADFQKVDLHGLHLQDKPYAFLGKIHADLNNVMPNELDGVVQINDFAFTDGKQIFALDTISLKATSQPNLKQLILNSQLLDAVVEGDYELTRLPGALTKSISKYFDLDGDAFADKTKVAAKEAAVDTLQGKDQKLKFFFQLKENPIIYQMVPGLKELEPLYFDGNYDSASDYIQMHGEIASVVYGENRITNIVFDMEPIGSRLEYFLDVAKFENANLAINKMALSGEISGNILTYDLDLKDEQDRVRYEIAGSLETTKDFMKVKLDPNGFRLNYDPWDVNVANEIKFGSEGILANAFELTHGSSKIEIQSEPTAFNAPLKIGFNAFDIETITQMIKQDSVLVSGFIDGDVLLRDLKNKMSFESDLTVTELKVLSAALGTLNVQVKSETASVLDAAIGLEGNGNKLSLLGKIGLADNSMDLKLQVDQLQMATLEGFTFENLKDSKGYLSGLLDIKGTFTKPSVLGNLDFNDVGMKVKALNAEFVDINESIGFTQRGIEFSKFSIADSDANVLVFDGQILTKDYSDFRFNLDIKAENFKAISSTAKDNDLYYGSLILDTDIKIRGNLNKPEVSGTIGVDKGTDFVFVMPQEDPSIADREGIVEFINQKNKRLEETLKIQKEFNESEVKGLDASIAIHISKDAQFTIVIDKANGDKISIKGEGDLMGGIDPSGKTTLTGRYEFEGGAYEMAFNFIKRKFEVQKGSSITWTGEPTDATLDLTAVYEVKAPPIDLLQNQLADLSPMEANMYKQKIPFKTLLMMKGELMKPDITFDIQLPDGNIAASGDVVSNTKTKLEQLRLQESELNKQVFALLLLNRFVGENPFESLGGGVTAEGLARQSVSKILSDQMNNLAGDLIAGVELDFNLESTDDYSTGEKENRTDLNIGVSKRMFNDRLKVTIGSSFGLEGSERQNEQSTNIAGDISAEYMLSKDGRYMLRAYRKNEYQVAIQGQVIETGVGFVITMSYEKFKEIFERRREKKELKEMFRNEKNN